MRNIVVLTLLTVCFLTGCASTPSTVEPATVFDVKVRIGQIRFKHFMVNLAMATSTGLQTVMKQEPNVDAVDVYIDYELPKQAVAEAPARMPVIVLIAWKDSKQKSENVGKLVQDAFVKAGAHRPVIESVISDGGSTAVQGYYLVQSTPTNDGVKDLSLIPIQQK